MANLQGALQDLDALQASLLDSKFELEDKLVELCGDPNPGDPSGSPGNIINCRCAVQPM